MMDRCMDNLRDIVRGIESLSEEDLSKLCLEVDQHKDIIIIGNGGSNAIASHISIDYTKFLNKRCISFDDAPRLTAYFNDYGTENAYSAFLKDFATDDHLVILISSSGESANILNATKYCMLSGIDYIILTGMKEDNRTRNLYGSNAKADIWVNSERYSVVECTHEACLHSLVDF